VGRGVAGGALALSTTERAGHGDRRRASELLDGEAVRGPGARDPAIVLEVQGFLDVLMRDLGLRDKRKKGWLGLKEWVVPYTSRDYRGVVREFLESVERGTE
jgi:hypothetical protein